MFPFARVVCFLIFSCTSFFIILSDKTVVEIQSTTYVEHKLLRVKKTWSEETLGTKSFVPNKLSLEKFGSKKIFA